MWSQTLTSDRHLKKKPQSCVRTHIPALLHEEKPAKPLQPKPTIVPESEPFAATSPSIWSRKCIRECVFKNIFFLSCTETNTWRNTYRDELRNIEEDKRNENLESLVQGPLFSWIDGTNVKSVNESIVNITRMVSKVLITFYYLSFLFHIADQHLQDTKYLSPISAILRNRHATERRWPWR